jgi:hypothetical protein
MVDRYLATVESIRGVSKDMNMAVDSHLQSVRRLQDVNKKIKKSYSDCLALFETARSSESPPRTCPT